MDKRKFKPTSLLMILIVFLVALGIYNYNQEDVELAPTNHADMPFYYTFLVNCKAQCRDYVANTPSNVTLSPNSESWLKRCYGECDACVALIRDFDGTWREFVEAHPLCNFWTPPEDNETDIGQTESTTIFR